MNYLDSLKYIHSLPRFATEPSLKRIETLLKKLDNPEKGLKYIHVAGTNGKGSVCSYVSSVLISAGMKVGTFISPFVLDFRERIKINGEFIAEDELVFHTEKVKKAVDCIDDLLLKPTEFDLITAIAFDYFNAQKCDVVVLEVGLGGRFDSTNIIENPACSVVTQIDYDHMAVLGNTINKIAYEKAGIIKQGCPVVTTSRNDAEATDVLQKEALEKGCKLLKNRSETVELIKSDFFGSSFQYNGENYEVSLVGDHQIDNAVTAIVTLKTVFKNLDQKTIYNGLKNTKFPARCEVICENPLVLLDGSHNENGIDALKKVVENSGVKQITAVVGVMADKQIELSLCKILPLFDKVIAVDVENNPRAMGCEDLLKICKQSCENAFAQSDLKSALNHISPDENVVVFGSLYLASAIRNLIIQKYNKNDNQI